MSSENASHNDPIAEMEKLLEKQYLDIMGKQVELNKKKVAKDPAADELALVIDQMQEHYDRLTKTHASFMRARKHFRNQGKSSDVQTQKEFEHLIAEMKSSTMGSIVDKIPPTNQ